VRTNIKTFIQTVLLCTSMIFMSSYATAAPGTPSSDEDTILVDYQPSNKVPYGRIASKVFKKLFNFDSERLMTFGGHNSSKVARTFSEYAARGKTRFKIKHDQIALEYKLDL